MAGKKSAKQVMDEWEQKIAAEAAIAGENAASAASAVGQGAKVAGNAALVAANPIGAALNSVPVKRFAQGAGIADKDAGYYSDQVQQAAGGMMPTPEEIEVMKQQAMQQAMQLGQQGMSAGKGLLDAAGSAYKAADAGKIPMRNLNTPYDIQMQGMDMQSTPETQAYWADVSRSANAPMAQKAGGLIGSGLDAAAGAIPAIKGMGQQFMQGLQGGSPVDQAQEQIGQSEAALQKMWESMTPIEKEMFMQEMQARKQGGTP